MVMTKIKKFAIVLSGCGVYDGSEIHEATLTLLAIDKLGGIYSIFAPNMEQFHVINHLTGKVEHEKRNVLVESARIARGKIQPLSDYKASEFDALIFPGGFGAAKNLSSYAMDGVKMKVIPDVERVILETAKQSKPIGAFCIAPVLISKVLGKVILTVGKDMDTAQQLETMGSTHVTTGSAEISIDTKNKIVTTPCYMLNSSITEIYDGIENAIRAIFKLME